MVDKSGKKSHDTVNDMSVDREIYLRSLKTMLEIDKSERR